MIEISAAEYAALTAQQLSDLDDALEAKFGVVLGDPYQDKQLTEVPGDFPTIGAPTIARWIPTTIPQRDQVTVQAALKNPTVPTAWDDFEALTDDLRHLSGEIVLGKIQVDYPDDEERVEKASDDLVVELEVEIEPTLPDKKTRECIRKALRSSAKKYGVSNGKRALTVVTIANRIRRHADGESLLDCITITSPLIQSVIDAAWSGNVEGMLDGLDEMGEAKKRIRDRLDLDDNFEWLVATSLGLV